MTAAVTARTVAGAAVSFPAVNPEYSKTSSLAGSGRAALGEVSSVETNPPGSVGSWNDIRSWVFRGVCVSEAGLHIPGQSAPR